MCITSMCGLPKPPKGYVPLFFPIYGLESEILWRLWLRHKTEATRVSESECEKPDRPARERRTELNFCCVKPLKYENLLVKLVLLLPTVFLSFFTFLPFNNIYCRFSMTFRDHSMYQNEANGSSKRCYRNTFKVTAANTLPVCRTHLVICCPSLIHPLLGNNVPIFPLGNHPSSLPNHVI